MFGAIFGYGFILMLTKVFPNVPGLGSRFGPQENSIVQASATGAGGMAGLFVAGLPAMYRLSLLSDNPKDDFPRILTITVVCAFFGLFAAVPLRKFFIINVARELNLVFPTPTATAMAIRSMHALSGGTADAMRKVKALGYAFIGAFVHIVVSQYANGILHNWHVFTWIYIWSGYKNWALNIENWGWYIQLTPAFFGSGILVGLNASISWFGGTVVAWGIIGPLLVHYGECIGIARGEGKWEGIVSFSSMRNIGGEGWVASPRYWMLWPGVMVLIVYSLVEFLLHFRVVYDGAKYALRELASSINSGLQKRGKNNSFLAKQAAKAEQESSLLEDFATPEEQVPMWIWMTGSVVMIIAACLVCELQFHINAGLAILSCILGLVFAFLSIYGGAVTDTAPLTASAKASQLVFGGITKNSHTLKDAQRVNLIAGNIASGTADVATNLVSDFRVGFLLRTPPNLQFYAQAMGAVVSVFLAPGIFVLFMSAYPCVRDVNAERCAFAAPSVVAWQAVAEAVTLPKIPIPLSSGIFSIVMAIICVIQAVVKNFYLVGPREKYREWLPNWMAIGVAWVLGPDAGYSACSPFLNLPVLLKLFGTLLTLVWVSTDCGTCRQYHSLLLAEVQATLFRSLWIQRCSWFACRRGSCWCGERSHHVGRNRRVYQGHTDCFAWRGLVKSYKRKNRQQSCLRKNHVKIVHINEDVQRNLGDAVKTQPWCFAHNDVLRAHGAFLPTNPFTALGSSPPKSTCALYLFGNSAVLMRTDKMRCALCESLSPLKNSLSATLY